MCPAEPDAGVAKSKLRLLTTSLVCRAFRAGRHHFSRDEAPGIRSRTITLTPLLHRHVRRPTGGILLSVSFVYLQLDERSHTCGVNFINSHSSQISVPFHRHVVLRPQAHDSRTIRPSTENHAPHLARSVGLLRNGFFPTFRHR